MRDGEFDYPEHPEEYMPSWMLDLEECEFCLDVIASSIPSYADWCGDVCTCGEEE
jgi:hypothetical protein|tara:strand:- start:800 stop:964 length:165 start_codon:yes stop_codon:yes gene_type:complete